MTAGVGWSAALADQVRAKLAVLDLTAARVLCRAVDAEAGRAELRGLIAAWRGLLVAHHPGDGQSRCPRCRSWWGWRRAWPCRVWRTAHESLVVVGNLRAAADPNATAAAVAWVREASPARPLGAWFIPAPRPRLPAPPAPVRLLGSAPTESLSFQSPVTSSAPPRLPDAGGTPGAAAPGSPAGSAAPGTSLWPRHARPEQPDLCAMSAGRHTFRVERGRTDHGCGW